MNWAGHGNISPTPIKENCWKSLPQAMPMDHRRLFSSEHRQVLHSLFRSYLPDIFLQYLFIPHSPSSLVLIEGILRFIWVSPCKHLDITLNSTVTVYFPIIFILCSFMTILFDATVFATDSVVEVRIKESPFHLASYEVRKCTFYEPRVKPRDNEARFYVCHVSAPRPRVTMSRTVRVIMPQVIVK